MDVGQRLQDKDYIERSSVLLQSYFVNCMERRDFISLIGTLTYSKQDLHSFSCLLGKLTPGFKRMCQNNREFPTFFKLLYEEAEIIKCCFMEHMFSSLEPDDVAKKESKSRRKGHHNTSSENWHKSQEKYVEHGNLIRLEKAYFNIVSNFPKTITENYLLSTTTPERLSSEKLQKTQATSKRFSQVTAKQTKFSEETRYKKEVQLRMLQRRSKKPTPIDNIFQKNGSISQEDSRKSKHSKSGCNTPEKIAETKDDFKLSHGRAGFKKHPCCASCTEESCKLARCNSLSTTSLNKTFKTGPIKRIALTGGISSSNSIEPSCAVYLYDPNCNSWQTLPSMKHARVNHGAAMHEGHLYVAGGNKGDFTQTNTVERYCFISRSWSTVFPMTEVREELSLVETGNKLYAIGGYNGTRDLESVENYYPHQDIWRFSAPLRMCRAGASVVTDQRYIYVIGGSCNQLHTTTLEVYDTNTHEWCTDLPNMQEARSYSCAAIIEKKIYVMGGFNNTTGYLNSCEVFDLKLQEWCRFPSMICTRMNAGVATFKNKIYIFGGESENTFLCSVEFCDLSRRKWEKISELPTTLTGCRATPVCCYTN